MKISHISIINSQLAQTDASIKPHKLNSPKVAVNPDKPIKNGVVPRSHILIWCILEVLATFFKRSVKKGRKTRSNPVSANELDITNISESRSPILKFYT
jgi:hypothetical protein